MEGRQPKRRKDKYNPYEIYEKDGKYYVSFRNGEKEYKDLDIGKNVYEAFNTFELPDCMGMWKNSHTLSHSLTACIKSSEISVG